MHALFSQMEKSKRQASSSVLRLCLFCSVFAFGRCVKLHTYLVIMSYFILLLRILYTRSVTLSEDM